MVKGCNTGLVGIVGLSIAALVQVGCHEPDPLTLVQDFSWSIDSMGSISMVALVDDSTVLLGTSSIPHLRIADRSGVRAIGSDSLFGKPIGARRIDEGFEVIDGNPPSLVRLLRSGELVSRTKLNVPQGDVVEAAVYADSAWFVSDLTIDGIRSLRRALPQTPTGEVWHGDGGDIYLNAGGSALVVSFIAAPFDATVFRGSRQLSLAVPLDTGLEHLQVPVIAGMPTVVVASGFLRTFADLSSDRSLLVLYDRSGRIRRQKWINVPMAFVDAHGKSVLAVRHAASEKLILYRLGSGGAQ